MVEKKIDTNPFDIFSEVGTRIVKIKALKNKEVTIQTTLTVDQEQTIRRIKFSNQEISGTSVIPNQADLAYSKRQLVSYILVEPKMTTTQLGDLNGADDAIEEIFISYLEYEDKQKEGN